MKAYQLRNSGKSDVLKIVEIPEPICAANEVKVKVQKIGINYAEILSRKGQYRWAPKRPYTPGMEAFGEIVEVGEHVTKRKVGDLVITGSQFGSYAEYLCVPEFLAFSPVPDFSSDQNVAVLVNYITAWVALVKLARIQNTDTVLIQVAAGGVGTAAVQLAKARGSYVFGTASNEEKLKLIRSLGADSAINYVTSDFRSEIKSKRGGVDIVLELVGGEVFRRSFEILNPFGKMVVAGYASIPLKKWNPYSWWLTWKNAPRLQVMDMAVKTSGLMATHIGYLTANQQIAAYEWGELRSFLIEHKIKPVVGRNFSFDEIPKAHDWMESRNSVGKIVIDVS